MIQNAAWARDQQVAIGMCNQLLNGMLNKMSSWGDIVDKKPGCKFLFYREGMSVSPPLMCPQTSLEPALKEHLDRKENVSMLWGWEVASLEQDANGATLTIVSGEGEDRREKQIQAKFVVACDGGSSPLRKLLNVHTYGEFFFARAVGMTISNLLFERLQQITGPGHFVVINKKFLAAFVDLKVAGEFSIHIILPLGTTDEKVNDIVSNPSRYIDMILGERVAHTVSVVSAYNGVWCRPLFLCW